jgi:hypothetical protein
LFSPPGGFCLQTIIVDSERRAASKAFYGCACAGGTAKLSAPGVPKACARAVAGTVTTAPTRMNAVTHEYLG